MLEMEGYISLFPKSNTTGYSLRLLHSPVTLWCDSVLKRECTSMVRWYSCVNDVRVDSSNTMMPPPSTVSIVRASKFGVSASKSCGQRGSVMGRMAYTPFSEQTQMPWTTEKPVSFKPHFLPECQHNRNSWRHSHLSPPTVLPRHQLWRQYTINTTTKGKKEYAVAYSTTDAYCCSKSYYITKHHNASKFGACVTNSDEGNESTSSEVWSSPLNFVYAHA